MIKMKKQTYVLLIISILFLQTFSFPAFSTNNKIKGDTLGLFSGEKLYVGGDGANNYTKIQNAIDNASDGDIVFIYNGVYNETLEINTQIFLIGESKNKTVIKGNYSKSVITINKQMIKLFNLRIQASGGKKEDALVKINSDHIWMINCVFEYSRNGVVASNKSDISIWNSIFYHTAIGITFDKCTNSYVLNTSFIKNGIGVLIKNSENINIDQCFGVFNGPTVNVDSSDNIEISNSTICKSNENQGGIYCEFSSNITVKNCSIYHNGYGVEIKGCKDSYITYCHVFDNKYGILLDYTNDTIISFCSVHNSDLCISTEYSYNVSVFSNNIYKGYVSNFFVKYSRGVASKNYWGGFPNPKKIRFKRSYFKIFPSLRKPVNDINPPLFYRNISYNSDVEKIYTINDSDSDNDLCPDWWENKYNYNPNSWDDHKNLDPDKDGLNNVEEYLTDEYGSNPHKKDIFVEVDVMDPSYKIVERKANKMINDFAKHNITLHIIQGELSGDVVEKKDYVNYETLINIYWDYFLDKNPQNWKKGVFHYSILTDSLFLTGFVFIGWDEADSFGLKANNFETLYAKIFSDHVVSTYFMHELGHTLGLFHDLFNGVDNYSSVRPFIRGTIVYKNYHSCMNYGYAMYILDYSDGTHGRNDFNDWGNIDLLFFQDSYWDSNKKPQ